MKIHPISLFIQQKNSLLIYDPELYYFMKSYFLQLNQTQFNYVTRQNQKNLNNSQLILYTDDRNILKFARKNIIKCTQNIVEYNRSNHIVKVIKSKQKQKAIVTQMIITLQVEGFRISFNNRI